MAYTTINDPTAHFNTVLYTGTGSSQAITGVGFQPDFTWIKIRNTADAHGLVDSTRGATKHLRSDSTASEFTRATDVSSFDSDGFTVVSDAQFNGSGNTYASWNWKASAGSTSSNSDGSITSTVQANTTAGFSIVTYTGNGTSGATIGHSLGVVPNVMIVKMRTDAGLNWEVYHSEVSSTPQNDFLLLNSTSAKQTASNRWNNTAPTSSVFTVGNGGGVNSSTKNYVAYLFNNVEGYSKFGSYTGNGSADGTFVYTGFRPAFVMVKRTDTTADWHIDDAKRNTFNPTDARLDPNSSLAESSSIIMHDFTSNGFKTRTTSSDWNASGGTFIYMAFAEFPFVSSDGVPTTAR